jgi:hypothetical protein
MTLLLFFGIACRSGSYYYRTATRLYSCVLKRHKYNLRRWSEAEDNNNQIIDRFVRTINVRSVTTQSYVINTFRFFCTTHWISNYYSYTAHDLICGSKQPYTLSDNRFIYVIEIMRFFFCKIEIELDESKPLETYFFFQTENCVMI